MAKRAMQIDHVTAPGFLMKALIPRPYVNLIVYHGVLAPNAKWRREVVA